MRVLTLSPDDIEIGERHRALSTDAVSRLAGSMQDIGLKQPISIRIVDEMIVDGELTAGVPVLVAGAHRLAAAKELGWPHIDCIEVEDDPIKAELWELAENLHRCDLTKEQKYEHLRRYAELIELRDTRGQGAQIAQPALVDGRKSGPQHQKSVNRMVADETGVSLDTVKRARSIRVDPPKPVEDERVARRGRAMSAWDKLDEEDRAWFRDWIDTPIMDARHAA